MLPVSPVPLLLGVRAGRENESESSNRAENGKNGSVMKWERKGERPEFRADRTSGVRACYEQGSRNDKASCHRRSILVHIVL